VRRWLGYSCSAARRRSRAARTLCPAGVVDTTLKEAGLMVRVPAVS